MPVSHLSTKRVLLRNGVIVLAYNTAIAALLAANGYGHGFWIILVYSQCIGLTGWIFIDGGRRLIWGDGTSSGWIWLLALAGIGIASTGGVALAALLLGHPLRAHNFVASLVISGVAAFISAMFFYERRRKEEVGRPAAEAQPRPPEARIEPHFLFQSLATLYAL